MALVGISLDAEKGTHQISITNPRTRHQFNAPFQVQAKHYRLQRLTIRDRNKVNPDQASSERIVWNWPSSNR
ncbi:MAG: hypothetical protein R3E89_00800 [Thiolinea sp.]